MKHQIANIFRATRKFHSLQQVEFAAILGVSQATISKIERANMACELALWFKFLRAFGIIDPYSFLYSGVEFNESQFRFKSLDSETSALAPMYTFFQDSFFQIKHIRPLYDYIYSNHKKKLVIFLKEKNIHPEIFQILNHPISANFVDDFFSLIVSCKISHENLNSLELDFTFSSYNSVRIKDFRELPDALEFFKGILGGVDFNLDVESAYYDCIFSDKFLIEISKMKNIKTLKAYYVWYPFLFLKFAGFHSLPLPCFVDREESKDWPIKMSS